MYKEGLPGGGGGGGRAFVSFVGLESDRSSQPDNEAVACGMHILVGLCPEK